MLEVPNRNTGRVGALVPSTSREDVDFLSLLEGYLQVEAPRPAGQDPQLYRSYYAPMRHIVDGDLCDEFTQLPYNVKQKIAKQLDRSVGEVTKSSRTSLLGGASIDSFQTPSDLSVATGWILCLHVTLIYRVWIEH